jgi:hypothetical protein
MGVHLSRQRFILKLFKEGLLQVDAETGTIYTSRNRGGKLTTEWREKPSYIDSHGYRIIKLRYKSKRYNIKAHVIVFLWHRKKTFDSKKIINHRDGDKTNPRISNLELISQSGNIKHAYKHGLFKPASRENHFRCKLSNNDIISIREKYATGNFTQRQLATDFNCSQKHISKIVNNLDRIGGATYA